jgi:hypothetical protein
VSEYGTAVDPEIVNEAARRAEDECIDLYAALIPRNVAPDGMTYGSQPMDRGQRIAAFLYRVQSGSLDLLHTISLPVYQRYVDEFLDDVSKTPAYSQTEAMVRVRAQLEQQGAPIGAGSL